MAYTINLTDGETFATVADGTINTASSMILVGKNYAGYGQFLDTNFMRLLENASNLTPPGAPIQGQLWWDKGAGVLKVYQGSTFKAVAAATSGGTAPAANISVIGDLWFDTTNQQLKVYNGSGWLLVGPQFTAGQGKTGAIPNLITDTNGISHSVIELYTNDVLVGIISKDNQFTPSVAIAGFQSGGINPGINLARTLPPNTGNVTPITPLFQGTAVTALFLQTGPNTQVNSTAFMSTISNTTTIGTVGILNDGGLTIGNNSAFLTSVSGTEVNLRNQALSGNLVIATTNSINEVQTAIVVEGETGNVSVKQINNLGLNGTGNIGNATNGFNTIFAKATSAQYADIAERFEIDVEMPPGTVVELGGTAEITCSKDDCSDKVFGVISTQAAYLMNSSAGTNATHPPIAMTGRVPVRVVGVVHKGDRLVSAGQGLARSAAPGEATWATTIGRALSSKLNAEPGTVEAIVTIK
jgi:hypothetical protein